MTTTGGVRRSASPNVQTPRPLRDFASLETLQAFAADDYLFVEGDAPRGVYLLHSGKVVLTMASKDGANRLLRTEGAGAVLGLSSAVSGHAHETTAQAVEPVRVGFIDRDAFLAALHENAEAWFAVLEMLSDDINNCYDLMRVFGTAERK